MKVHPGGSHWLCCTDKYQLIADLLAFLPEEIAFAASYVTIE